MTSNTSGFTPSRRTLVKGAAWSVPVVAIAAPAQAVGCSVDPTPCLEECLEFSTVGDSYKVANKSLYYVSFVFTNTCDAGTTPPPGEVCLTMENNSPFPLMDPCDNSQRAVLCFTMPAPGESVVIPHAYYYAESMAQEVTFLYQGQPIGSVDTGGSVNNQLPGPNCPNGFGGDDAGTEADLQAEEPATEDLTVEEPTTVETQSVEQPAEVTETDTPGDDASQTAQPQG